MTYNRFISTAVLLMLLGITIPAFAQKGEGEKGGGGGKARRLNTKRNHSTRRRPRRNNTFRKLNHNAPKEPHRNNAHRKLNRSVQKKQRHNNTHRNLNRSAQKEPRRNAQRKPSAACPGRRASHRRPEANKHGPLPATAAMVTTGNHGNYGRISNANYSPISVRPLLPHGSPELIGGYNRFQYGRLLFGYNEGWPIGWNYDDNCYVVYEDGAYYMYDLNHPGIHISSTFSKDLSSTPSGKDLIGTGRVGRPEGGILTGFLG